jgi:hypothetical protein
MRHDSRSGVREVLQPEASPESPASGAASLASPGEASSDPSAVASGAPLSSTHVSFAPQPPKLETPHP